MSRGRLGDFVNVSRDSGIVDGEALCYLKEMHGRHPNQDTYLGAA